ncbi:MAG: hypothetical protein GTN62_04330 [Gemmatimonadales bacterium]|nr:hypothetical protein [Gemmatimonadales bacterium]NIP06790.1 hypothetical protein [Gemmatimonadales bacterium]
MAGLCCVASPSLLDAQVATAGVGVLLTKRSTDPVAEVYVASPPLWDVRAYATFSWTDDDIEPTIISAVDRVSLRSPISFTTAGVGFLWLAPQNHRPYPIVVSTTVITVPLPRTSIVLIGSTQPFQSWDWSVVAKVAVTVLFMR